jgi:hypothetical protein
MFSFAKRLACAMFLVGFACSAGLPAGADDTPATSDKQSAAVEVTGSETTLQRIAKEHEAWVDLKRKLVVVDGQVCLREGQLEMFACPKGTKEHESIVSVNSSASVVHTGLLLVGAKVGRAVQFDPKYVPASGTIVDVWVLWTDAEGQRHKIRAQEWIKHLATGKAMEYSWVFAGSGFWVDEATNTRHYQGDAGDLICVSNFPTATLDLPVRSSQESGKLLFAAYTERIPPLQTKVRLVLIPRQNTPAASGEQEGGKSATATSK